MTAHKLAADVTANPEAYGPFQTPDESEHPITLPLRTLPGRNLKSGRLSALKQAAGAVVLQTRLIISRASKKLRRLRRAVARSRWGAALLARFRRSPRTAGVLVGALIIAAVLMFWRKAPDVTEAETTADTEWKLEKVQIFPPSETQPETGAISAPKILQASDVSAKSLTDGSNSPPRTLQPMPDTPRPVWLTGVIEDIHIESDVRRIGHVELPMESRNRTTTQTPPFPAYRRR